MTAMDLLFEKLSSSLDQKQFSNLAFDRSKILARTLNNFQIIA